MNVMGKRWFGPLVLLVALVAGIVVAYQNARLYVYQWGFAGSQTYNLLFNSGLGMMLVGAGFGIVVGAASGLLGGPQGTVNGTEAAGRRSGGLLEDWGLAFSSLASVVLIVTGVTLGGIWSPRLVTSLKATAVVMNMHFVGVVFLLFGSVCLATRVLVSRDFGTLTSVVEACGAKRNATSLPAERWARCSLVCAFATFAVKGSVLAVVHLFHLPVAVSIAGSAIHDVLGLVTLMLGLAAIACLVLKRPSQARRGAG